MTTKLEEIARAMREQYNAEFCSGELVPFEKSKAREEWLSCALAAVRAMRREPSDAIIEVAARAEAAYDGRTFDVLGAADKRRYRERFAATFAAAIDAILSEAGEPK